MTGKHTYKAILPDGKITTRTTTRKYTHLIAVFESDEDVKRYNHKPGWFALTWCGTPVLAEKAYNVAKNAKVIKSVDIGTRKNAPNVSVFKMVKTSKPLWIRVKKIPVV